MPIFRIFTNDRGKKRGVPMYSALMEVTAKDAKAALKSCPPQFDTPHYAPAVAIIWPEKAQSANEKQWLKKHIGQ